MPVEYACIVPHGSETIELLASPSAAPRFNKSREAMQRLAADIGKARPDCMVIATPHNLRLRKHIGVILSEFSSGRLQASIRNKATVNLKARCDVEFARKILSKGEKAGLPVVGASYGTESGRSSDLPMDWGTLVPLWFIRKRTRSKIVIVTPSREIPLRQNFEFGRMLGKLAEKTKKRVIFIASADQAHAHRRSGPFGYSPAAKMYDSQVVHAIEANDLQSLMTMRPDLVERAKPDSLWQMIILAGVLDVIPMRSEFLSYHVPTYFGMICAGFHR